MAPGLGVEQREPERGRERERGWRPINREHVKWC